MPSAKMLAGVACISDRFTPKKNTSVEAELSPTVALTSETKDSFEAMPVSVADAIPCTVTGVEGVMPAPPVAEKFTTVPSGAWLPSIHTWAVTVVSSFPFAYRIVLADFISIGSGAPFVCSRSVSSLNAFSELLNSPVSALILKAPGSQSAV